MDLPALRQAFRTKLAYNRQFEDEPAKEAARNDLDKLATEIENCAYLPLDVRIAVAVYQADKVTSKTVSFAKRLPNVLKRIGLPITLGGLIADDIFHFCDEEKLTWAENVIGDYDPEA